MTEIEERCGGIAYDGDRREMWWGRRVGGGREEVDCRKRKQIP